MEESEDDEPRRSRRDLSLALSKRVDFEVPDVVLLVDWCSESESSTVWKTAGTTGSGSLGDDSTSCNFCFRLGGGEAEGELDTSRIFDFLDDFISGSGLAETDLIVLRADFA